MTATPAKIKSRLAHWREWEPNPILLKELRQAVRSDALSGMLLFLLAMLYLGCVAYLSGHGLVGEAAQMGQAVFRAVLSALAIISLLFIPVYTGIRLALERQQADLMFFTTLSSSNVVHGKFLSGATLAVVFFSACLPFMAFSTLLRGVDLPTSCFIFVVLFAAACVAILAAIAVAVMPFHLVFRALLGIILTAALIALGGMLLDFFFLIVESGVGMMATLGSFGTGFMAALWATALGATICYGTAITFMVGHRTPPENHNQIATPEPAG